MSVSKRIITYESIGFAGIVAFIWLDEVFDLPDLLLGAAPTPINWREAGFESLFVTILGLAIVAFTLKMFRRMKYLEGILPVCAACKKIRDENGRWQPIESYIHDRSDARCSHGICPECTEKLYPDIARTLRESKK